MELPTMISGHVALVRKLRSFMEESGLPWHGVHFVRERNDDGNIVMDDRRLDIWFPYENQKVDVYIIAPGETDPHCEVQELLPNGKLAARKDGAVVKGPIDQSTWDDILKLIRG
jgi:hypothetical protein